MTEIAVGTRVTVKRDQKGIRLGPPQFPGRTGTVARLNSHNSFGSWWYVDLDATTRAAARQELFSADLLEVIE